MWTLVIILCSSLKCMVVATPPGETFTPTYPTKESCQKIGQYVLEDMLSDPRAESFSRIDFQCISWDRA
jgi:hypothetical protein